MQDECNWKIQLGEKVQTFSRSNVSYKVRDTIKNLFTELGDCFNFEYLEQYAEERETEESSIFNIKLRRKNV